MDFKNDNIWLMKGDCLERMKEIPDGSVDMILTDPPYGTTACKWDSIIDLELMWKELKRITKIRGVVVLFGNEPFSSSLRMSNIKEYKYDWIWQKEVHSNFFQAKYCPLNRTENISVFGDFGINSGCKKVSIYNPQGVVLINEMKVDTGYAERQLGNAHKSSLKKGNNYTQKYTNYPHRLLDFSRDKGAMHPTQKPVALMEYLIKTYTNEGETILDFTFGSGATIKAARNLNRKAIGIENGKCEKKGHKYGGVHWVDVLVDNMGLDKED